MCLLPTRRRVREPELTTVACSDWNESFDVDVKDGSILTVQIFDQKKFKKKDQGFLGVINIPIAQAVDLDLGGEGTSLSNRGCRGATTSTI